MRALAQLPLMFTGAPFSDPDTSREAAKQIEPHLQHLEARVLVYITMQGAWGATDQEIERGTGLSGNTVRPRRVALAERGYIRKDGTRPTASGRKASVWRAV